MRKLLTTIILCFGIHQSYCQTLTDEDFKSLVPYLQKEDWKSAFIQSTKLLNSAERDTSDYHAKILYINIFAAAGMVSVGDMTYSTLSKNVLKFKGRKVIMPFHPVSDVIPLSATSLTVNDSVNQAFTSAANSLGTNIFCFETFEIKDKINVADFPEGSFIQCGGILSKIETNPNKSKIWVLRLTVSNAFIRKDN